MQLQALNVGDVVNYMRQGVGVYQCEITAIVPGDRRPLSLRPLRMMGSDRQLHGRVFRASLAGVRGLAKAA